MVAWPLGTLPPIAGPDSAPGSLGECVQPGSPAGGTGLIVWLNACVAVWPDASVTRTVNVNVPVCDGKPTSVPSALSVVPGGTVPAASDHVSGVAETSPFALNDVNEKSFTSVVTPVSQTPFGHGSPNGVA